MSPKTKVWKTVQVGGMVTEEKHHVYIGELAYEIMRSKKYKRTGMYEAKLAVRCPRELGFGHSSPTTDKLLNPERLTSLGLKLCDPRVGPALAREYHPVNKEYLHIAMSPIEVQDGGPDPSVFVLYFDSKDYGCPCLFVRSTVKSDEYGYPLLEKPARWHHSDQFVFEMTE